MTSPQPSIRIASCLAYIFWNTVQFLEISPGLNLNRKLHNSAHAPDPQLSGTILSHEHCNSDSQRQFTIATSVRQQCSIWTTLDAIKTLATSFLLCCSGRLERSATVVVTDDQRRDSFKRHLKTHLFVRRFNLVLVNFINFYFFFFIFSFLFVLHCWPLVAVCKWVLFHWLIDWLIDWLTESAR